MNVYNSNSRYKLYALKRNRKTLYYRLVKLLRGSNGQSVIVFESTFGTVSYCETESSLILKVRTAVKTININLDVAIMIFCLKSESAIVMI